jgi:cobalt-zinc-cadmium efflux system outer membrane protein
MKWGRDVIWVLLLAVPAGCQNPMQSAAFKNLEMETRGLAEGVDKDRSTDFPMARTSFNKNSEASKTSEVYQNPIQLAAYQEKEKPKKEPKVILTIPKELPGGDFKGFKLPKDKAEFEKYLKKIYPPLPPLEDELILAPGPEGRPMTLADLQRLATQYSPTIRSAEAGVAAARGGLRQSMAYPNPTFSFMNDTLGTGPAGYPGFAIDQVIKTGNKLPLQGAAATMDLLNAQVALRRARTDVAYQVRTNYFAVLTALENMKLSRAYAGFTDQIYSAQVKMMKGNVSAFYEPMQLRPLALQARFNLIQATNQYQASWRQLAVSLGLPDMPPSEIAGRIDMPVPVFEYQEVLQLMLSRHTDVLTAQNNVHKAEYLLKLARITPIPDVEVMALVQKDYTTPPFLIAPSVHVGVPVPVWDRNQGGIQQAQGFLSQALHNLSVAKNALTNSLADAFNRYLTSKRQVEITHAQVIDQVRVYGRVYARHQAEPDAVTFGDIVTAQQTLGTYISAYLAALGAQWTAVVDVANLLQTDDLFKGTSGDTDDPDVPGLEEIEGMIRYRESEVRSQRSEVRSQKSEIANPKSEVRGQESAITRVKHTTTEIGNQRTAVEDQTGEIGKQDLGGPPGSTRLVFQPPIEDVQIGATNPFILGSPLLTPPKDEKSTQGAN